VTLESAVAKPVERDVRDLLDLAVGFTTRRATESCETS
jgi:hypothetical protein